VSLLESEGRRFDPSHPDEMVRHSALYDSGFEETKDETEFRWRNKSKGWRSPWCKPCFKAYEREEWATNAVRRQSNIAMATKRKYRNAQFIWNYLKEHPCITCGEGDPVVLDFDHRDDEVKVGNISEMSLRMLSLNRLLSEIAKCDVLCSNCHRRRTALIGIGILRNEEYNLSRLDNNAILVFQIRGSKMKRALIGLALVASVLLSGCAGPVQTATGVKAKPYGFFNEATAKSTDPTVRYEVSPGSVIVAFIFSETIIVPIYVIGWDLFKPVIVSN
jgi:hypothetical protein